jgi:putative component of toxin-antitoxin plasmid stabilization module
MILPLKILRYVTANGTDIVGEWLVGLKDVRTRAKIVARIDRLAAGNFGDANRCAVACMSYGSTGDRAIEFITRR